LSYSDGVFEGEWTNDKRNGYGYYKSKYDHTKSDYYEGEYVNAKKEGFGICKLLNGGYYEGMWK